MLTVLISGLLVIVILMGFVNNTNTSIGLSMVATVALAGYLSGFSRNDIIPVYTDPFDIAPVAGGGNTVIHLSANTPDKSPVRYVPTPKQLTMKQKKTMVGSLLEINSHERAAMLQSFAQRGVGQSQVDSMIDDVIAKSRANMSENLERRLIKTDKSYSKGLFPKKQTKIRPRARRWSVNPRQAAVATMSFFGGVSSPVMTDAPVFEPTLYVNRNKRSMMDVSPHGYPVRPTNANYDLRFGNVGKKIQPSKKRGGTRDSTLPDWRQLAESFQSV